MSERTPRIRGRARGSATASDPAPLRGQGKGDQLVEILEQLVATSAPGDLLPSERELASRYGVARMTVRGAISNLVAQGLVHRVQGQGTFVSAPRIAQPSTLTSFTEDMRSRGMTPSAIVLAQQVEPAGHTVGLNLELATDEPVVRLERVRLGDGDPIALERAHLPLRRFPGLDRMELATTSLYDVLADRYGCVIATSQQRIAAVRLTDAEAHLLHADPSMPALRIERVTRCRQGSPVEFVRSVYRGDRYELHTEQHRQGQGGPSHAERSQAASPP